MERGHEEVNMDGELFRKSLLTDWTRYKRKEMTYTDQRIVGLLTKNWKGGKRKTTPGS